MSDCFVHTPQVNPLTQYKHALEMLATPSVLLTTAEMFVQLTLSHLRLRCVISLSFSKTSGLAMTFRDDPLESLNVSSSFDSFGVVQQFIQSVRHSAYHLAGSGLANSISVVAHRKLRISFASVSDEIFLHSFTDFHNGGVQTWHSKR